MMKTMPTLFFTVITLIFSSSFLSAQTIDTEKEVLTSLLHEFLEGASYNDPETHDRFWAEDLIYTGSNGNRIGKPDIMNGLSGTPDRSVAPETRYNADQVQINVYDDMAVLAFRLIAHFNEPEPGAEETRYYYNTGTFLKRDGEWRAVAWQATVIP